MSDVEHEDDPTEYMEAMGPIMIAGTAVGPNSWFVEKGVDAATAQFPVLILTCPSTEQTLEGITGFYQATFGIQGLYLDRWEASSRSFEQCALDAKKAVYRMARNIRLQPDLGMTFDVGGTSRGELVQANNRIAIRMGAKPVTDPGLGFPLVTVSIAIDVLSPHFQPS